MNDSASALKVQVLDFFTQSDRGVTLVVTCVVSFIRSIFDDSSDFFGLVLVDIEEHALLFS